MKLQKHTKPLLNFVLAITLAQCQDEGDYDPCEDLPKGEEFDDVVLYASSRLDLTKEQVAETRKKSRVCFPDPCKELKAYSGFIPVDDNQYLFFLHIKSQAESDKKPLLLWLQGGPGKSSLNGQFLENGPLGIDASGDLYYREHTLLTKFNIIYLDQPVGAGYSFGKYYPGSLEEATINVIHFLTRFQRIFPEYHGKKFYVAGESYGARFAVGVAKKILTQYDENLQLNLAGVMLGVGFLFPLVDIINSAEYLLYSSLLDDMGYQNFTKRFGYVQTFLAQKNYTAAAMVLSQTVLNLRRQGQRSLFQVLTGFELHASIAYTKRPQEYLAYFAYANSTDFKKRIHVSSSSTLDGKRFRLAMNLSMYDFFVDITKMVEDVLDMSLVLFYTAQFDDVFPAVNLESQFRKLSWRSSSKYKSACRVPWYHSDNSSGSLRGYEKKVPGALSATVLFGGHYISQDRSEAVSELYGRFLKFSRDTIVEPDSDGTGSCYMMKTLTNT